MNFKSLFFPFVATYNLAHFSFTKIKSAVEWTSKISWNPVTTFECNPYYGVKNPDALEFNSYVWQAAKNVTIEPLCDLLHAGYNTIKLVPNVVAGGWAFYHGAGAIVTAKAASGLMPAANGVLPNITAAIIDAGFWTVTKHPTSALYGTAFAATLFNFQALNGAVKHTAQFAVFPLKASCSLVYAINSLLPRKEPTGKNLAHKDDTTDPESHQCIDINPALEACDSNQPYYSNDFDSSCINYASPPSNLPLIGYDPVV